jgi:hypothetical protein
MTMIDNGQGIGAHVVQLGPDSKQQKVVNMIEFEDFPMEMNDNVIYGESEMPDCPSNFNSGDFCILKSKFGAFQISGAAKGKAPHILAASKFPIEKIKGDAIWGPKSIWRRNRFVNWNYKTREGMANTILGSSGY